MAGTGGRRGGAARSLFSKLVPARSAWKKSQDKDGCGREDQGRDVSPETRRGLRLHGQLPSKIFHPGHCGSSPCIAV